MKKTIAKAAPGVAAPKAAESAKKLVAFCALNVSRRKAVCQQQNTFERIMYD